VWGVEGPRAKGDGVEIEVWARHCEFLSLRNPLYQAPPNNESCLAQYSYLILIRLKKQPRLLLNGSTPIRTILKPITTDGCARYMVQIEAGAIKLIRSMFH
jgi:hypothetical protein